MTFDQYSRPDLAVKSWAETDELVRDYIQRTYQIRYDVLKDIFKALGFEGNYLEVRTRLFVVYET